MTGIVNTTQRPYTNHVSFCEFCEALAERLVEKQRGASYSRFRLYGKRDNAGAYILFTFAIDKPGAEFLVVFPDPFINNLTVEHLTRLFIDRLGCVPIISHQNKLPLIT